MSMVGGSDRYSSNNGEVGVRVAKTGSSGRATVPRTGQKSPATRNLQSISLAMGEAIQATTITL